MKLTGVLAFFLFVGGLAAGFVLFKGKPIDPVVIRHIDSVLVDTTKHTRDSLVVVATRAERQARHWKAIADTAHARVDTALVYADTAAALEASQAEAQSLRVALDRQMAATAQLMETAKLANDRITTLSSELWKARQMLSKVRAPKRWGVGCAAGLGLRGVDAVCGLTVHL